MKIVTPSVAKFLYALFCILLLSGKFSSAQDNTWFKDVSHDLGFNVVKAGAIIGLDVNNDEFPDLITLGAEWKLYINTERPGSGNPYDRIFVDKTAGCGLDAVSLKDLGAAGDFNNDGNIDILTNRWYHTQNPDYTVNPDDGSRVHLLLGDGKGHFTLKTDSKLEDLGPMAGVGFPSLDFDRDGNLDVYIPNHYKGWFNTPGPSFLMKGNGDGTFTNVSVSAGISTPYRPLFGANMADWNNDCYPDILTAPYEVSGYGGLFKNNGDGTFTDVGQTAGYDPHWMAGDNGQAMVPWAAMPNDYDNDGDLDFLVLEVHGGTGGSEGRSAIFTNQGAAGSYALVPDVQQIVRVTPQSTHHGDHNGFWMDFDNDGWSDLIVGDAVYANSTDRMYFCKQDANHKFNDITKELGFITGTTASSISDRIRHPSVMIPMDYDLDGDDDIFKTCYNSDDTLNFLVLRNDAANKNNHVEIKLLPSAGMNKDCVGARVTVKAGNLKQMREVYGDQGSFTNQFPYILNFGLAKETNVDSIIINWPDASCSKTVITNVPVNKFMRIDKTGVNSTVDFTANKPDFDMYPNPNGGDVLNISLNRSEAKTIEVYNNIGQRVMFIDKPGSAKNIEVPVGNLTTGLYWVRVSMGGANHSVTKSFVRTN